MSKFPLVRGRMATVIVSLSTAVMLSGAVMVIPQVASAISVADLQAQIAALTAQLNQLVGQQAAPAGACTFTRSLTVGVTGDDVKCLQQYLNSTGNTIAASGAGSAGNESTYFGTKTKAAVAKWQAANGVAPAAGYFGSISRAKYSALVAAKPPTTPPTTPATTTPPAATGTGLTVAAAAQPGDTLAPLNAARVPVAKFTLTASNDGDVRVNSVTVERQGLATDASVANIIILDENGIQVGLSKTLNANHQAILNNTFTVPKGSTHTYTVAINRPSAAANAETGNIAKFAVVAVDAGAAAVSGSLPIVGSMITMNGSLTIGSATLTLGVNSPNTNQTKQVGTTGYIFSAIRITAGSAEDLSFRSISWNQSGSAGATDLQNIKININGTDYPATVSSDGKYYTASIPAGVDISKGNTIEVYVKGDIVGGSARTAQFDIYRFTDVYTVGKQYGFGITPTATDSGDTTNDHDHDFQTSINPSFDGDQVTIGAGTITVTASTAIPAQNVAVNLSNQPLGAFDVEVKGEDVTVSSIVIRVSTNANNASITTTDWSQIALYDNTTGKVVAGPKDGPTSTTVAGQLTLTYTDSVTFPVGKRAYVLKGKLSTDFPSDMLVAASTTPNTDWTSIVGQTSGNSITAANTGTVSGNSMTVKTGAVSIGLTSSPTAQTVIRGAKSYNFANLVFDATNSGEDVRFTTAQVVLFAKTAGDVTNCQLFDGTTALNTGSNIVNPSAAGNQTFTLDTNLTVNKGSSKNIALNCDVSKSGTGLHVQWTIGSTATGDGVSSALTAQSFGASGLTSGSTITPGVASSSVGNLMTMSAGGTLAVTLDPSSPSVRLAQSGQEVTASTIRITASNEDVNLKQIAFTLTTAPASGLASSTISDIQKVTLYDGATKVGEVLATSSASGIVMTIGSCTGCSTLTVSKDTDKVLTVKTQLSDISGANPVGRPGHLVVIDWNSVNLNGLNATYGTGVQSTSNIYATGNTTASAGVRMVRAYPTLTVLPVPSSTLANGSQSLYRFSVSAPAGGNGVSLYKVTFNITTSTTAGNSLSITSLQLFAYTGSNFSGGAYTSDGQLNNGSTFYTSNSGNNGINIGNQKATTSDYAIYFNPVNNTSAAPEAIFVPQGQTYYFELKGNVSGAVTGSSATTLMEGDRSWFGYCTGGGTVCDNNFLAGDITYAFATSAPFVDQPHNNSGGFTVAGGQSGAVSATQTWNNQTGAGANFIWSGNSTTTHSGAAGGSGPDWYNGFVVPGLPTSGTSPSTLTK